MIKAILIVGLGGMFGSVFRYVFSVMVKANDFPFATFIVNIAGSFIIGLVIGASLKNDVIDNNWKLFLATGVCGGFTTFSAFSLECIELFKQQRYFMVLVYIIMSIILGLAATFAGLQLTKGN